MESRRFAACFTLSAKPYELPMKTSQLHPPAPLHAENLGKLRTVQLFSLNAHGNGKALFRFNNGCASFSSAAAISFSEGRSGNATGSNSTHCSLQNEKAAFHTRHALPVNKILLIFHRSKAVSAALKNHRLF